MWIGLLLALVTLQSPFSAEYDRAVELARTGDLDEARAILNAIRDADPSEKRAHIELAGIAFREEHYSEARDHLYAILKTDPSDAYAADFLATVYLLDNNIEAALKYWNEVGKPQIGRVTAEPPFEIDPVLWDRAFAFSPSSMLNLEDFRETQARLDSLDLLAGGRFDLLPSGTRMDLEFHPVRLGGNLSAGRWGRIVAIARGLPYETIELNFRNIDSRGINVSTLGRWDDMKRRVAVRFATPLAKQPARRFEWTADGRDEAWVLPDEAFRVRKLKTSARIRQSDDRWTWTFGVNVSNRSSGMEKDRNGFLLTYESGFVHRFLAVPEWRFKGDVGVSTEFGRQYLKGTGVIDLEWLSGAAQNYKAKTLFRLGRIWGETPFDELFVLGMSRDHDLLLRAHPGSAEHGEKQGPVTRGFMLWNIDLSRRVLDLGGIVVWAGPFVDVARVRGERRFLTDTGIRLEAALLNGFVVDFSLGLDLQDHTRATFYRSRWQ